MDKEKYTIMIPSVYIAKDDESTHRIEGLTIVVEDRPGLLGDLLRSISDLRLNILRIDHSERKDGELCIYIVFELPADLLSRKKEVMDEVTKRLLSFKEVKRVEPADKRGRVIFLKGIGGYEFLGEPAIVIGKANMLGFTIELSKSLGKDVARLAIHHIAKSIGETAGMLYLKKTGMKTIDDALLLMKYILEGSSWVRKMDLSIITPEAFQLALEDPWECLVVGKDRNLWDEPYFVISVFRGYLEYLFGNIDFSYVVKWRDGSCEVKITVKRLLK
jgi:predicted amino acid-binding ACT domain protein